MYLRLLIHDSKELRKEEGIRVYDGSGKNISTYVPCFSPLSLIF
jgi:hypothetical protein